MSQRELITKTWPRCLLNYASYPVSQVLHVWQRVTLWSILLSSQVETHRNPLPYRYGRLIGINQVIYQVSLFPDTLTDILCKRDLLLNMINK